MNVSSMRLADRLLGLPLCWLLTLWRRLVQWSGAPRYAAPRKVLFIKLAEQGSTVLAYRALRIAADRYGAENLYFMVFEDNRFILDELNIILPENVLAINADNLGSMIRGTLSAVRRARQLEIDATIDLEFFARSTAIISYMTGAAVRVGYHGWNGEGPYRGDLMTHRLFFNHHLHTSDAFQLHVEALEHAAEALPFFSSEIRLTFGSMDMEGPVKTRFRMPSRNEDYPQMQVSAEDKDALKAKVKEAAGDELTGKKLILLNPNCSDMLPLRRWADENYIALAQQLLDAHGDVAIAMTGAPGDAEDAESLVKRVGRDRCFNMAGRTTMRELLVLYHLADVLVTNDSGPAHFASLTPIHSVVLFGPEAPSLFGARSSRSILLWAGTAFTPCVHALNNRESPSQENDCMSLIPVDDVQAAIEEILAEQG